MKKKSAGRAGAQPVLVAQASRVQFSGPALVPIGSCPNVPGPCLCCHYCKIVMHGENYWERGL